MSDLSELALLQNRLRRDDYAAFLAVKRAPARLRPPLFWLEGFYKEVSDIPYRVDEPFLAEIRLQWWRDGLDKILRGERLGHPIADGLAPFLTAHGEMLKQPLLSVLNSFEAEVLLSPAATKEAFFARFRCRMGKLLEARFLMAGERDFDVELLGGAGVALGVSETLAHLPRALQKGFPVLPQDVLDRHELSYEDLVAKEAEPRFARAYGEMVEGAPVISWDINKRLQGLPFLHRVLLARWVLVPGLLRRALADRAAGRAQLSRQNPLSQFYRLLVLRP